MFLLSLAFALPHNVPVPCRTPQLLAQRNEEHRLGATASFGPSPYRPEAVGYVDSEVYPLRIHYRLEEDLERAQTLMLPLAEMCWQMQIDEMGWPEPPADSGLGGDDRYDIYLTNEETGGGAYTWGTGNDTNADDNWYSLSSYIAVDDRWITDEDMPDFVCHEFNHALQYTIDGWELTLFPWEMTAEAMEELTVPDTDLYQIDIPDFQEFPFMSLLFDGYSPEIMDYNPYSYYEYGGSIVGLYLEQRLGAYDGTTLLALWDAMAQPDTSNEPDFVDALNEVGGTTLEDHGAIYLELAEWRMFANELDDGAHFYEGAEWGSRSIVAMEGVLTLDGLGTFTPVDPPYDLGTSYWQVDVGDGTNQTLRIEMSSTDDVEWGIVGAAWMESGPARVASARGGMSVTLDLDLTDATRAMFGVASLGTADLDAQGNHPRRDFTVTLSLVEPEEEDSGDTGRVNTDSGNVDSDPPDTTDSEPIADDPGDDPKADSGEDAAGCGCATGAGDAASGGATGAVALLLMAALRSRRRA